MSVFWTCSWKSQETVAFQMNPVWRLQFYLLTLEPWTSYLANAQFKISNSSFTQRYLPMPLGLMTNTTGLPGVALVTPRIQELSTPRLTTEPECLCGQTRGSWGGRWDLGKKGKWKQGQGRGSVDLPAGGGGGTSISLPSVSSCTLPGVTPEHHEGGPTPK